MSDIAWILAELKINSNLGYSAYIYNIQVKSDYWKYRQKQNLSEMIGYLVSLTYSGQFRSGSVCTKRTV